MTRTKLRLVTSTDTYEARLIAAQSFTKGVCVRHQVTGKQGSFQKINLGFALPEVWVQFDSDMDSSVPISCNPLDLVIVDSETEQPQVSSSLTEPGITSEFPQQGQLEETHELSDAEAAERHRLELKVERAFYEAGTALRILRDKRLYRSTHKTFEDYCQYRFGYHRRHSYQLIDAAAVVENLCANSAQKDPKTTGVQVLPTSEYQIRPLTQLEPVEQVEIWQQAVEEAGNKVPSGRIVKSIVEQLKHKPLIRAVDYCSLGDLFTLISLEGTERKYNTCWAISSGINEFTIAVDVHDTTLLVKPENLKPIDEPEAYRQLPQILARIKRLRECGLLDRCAYTVLESLGQQTYLSEVEEKVLSCLEEHYRIKA